MKAASVRTHPLAKGVPPVWASAWGEDARFGPWAELVVEGVTVRFRWIPPGRFMMGSPDDELGHHADEDLHEVTLTSGYWLAETACTQALWCAVMQDNPSHFVDGYSLEHPAEQVSWDACQKFITALAELSGGGGWRLPTEPEWERACRGEGPAAGMATYAGGWASEDEAHRILDGIAWHSRIAGRETHPVGEKEPNSWGLYDMLGNVWEWCQDAVLLDEKRGVVEVPADAKEEDVRRAARGGSWRSGARFVRAACRDAYHPSYCARYLGFRLARGPEAPSRASR